VKLSESLPSFMGLLELRPSLRRLKLSYGSSIASPSTISSRVQPRKEFFSEDDRRKRERYEEFLKSVSLFSNMDSYERSKLAEAFREHEFA